jgi:hypothetical protein
MVLLFRDAIMINRLIKTETNKLLLYSLAIFIVISIVWGIIYLVPDLLVIGGILTLFFLYQIIKKIPEFNFWSIIKKRYIDGTLEDFIDEEYETKKTVIDNRRTQKNSINIKMPRYNFKQSLNSTKSNHRFKMISQLKRLIDSEKDINQNEFDY